MQLYSECQIEGLIMEWEQVPRATLSDTQFWRWQALLESRTGMYIPIERKSLLQSNLSIRMRELGCRDFGTYYDMVEAVPSGVVEWNILVDRIMVQETRFYRNPESLQLLEQFIAERLDSEQPRLPLNIWSVGCSTGEEPYTLAIIVHDQFADRDLAPAYGVSATDISLPALHKAREGVYSKRKLADAPQSWLNRYFDAQGGELFRVIEDVRNRVCFSMTNMIEIERSPLRNMDVIYCQNVLIYFRRERMHQILDALAERLAPGGVLIIGQGEATSWRNNKVDRMPDNQTLAFRRRANHQQTTH